MVGVIKWIAYAIFICIAYRACSGMSIAIVIFLVPMLVGAIGAFLFGRWWPSALFLSIYLLFALMGADDGEEVVVWLVMLIASVSISSIVAKSILLYLQRR